MAVTGDHAHGPDAALNLRRPCPQPYPFSCDKPRLLPASIIGITHIGVKGTLTDTESKQPWIRSGLRRSRACYGQATAAFLASGCSPLGRPCLAGEPGLRRWTGASAPSVPSDGSPAVDGSPGRPDACYGGPCLVSLALRAWGPSPRHWCLQE